MADGFMVSCARRARYGCCLWLCLGSLALARAAAVNPADRITSGSIYSNYLERADRGYYKGTVYGMSVKRVEVDGHYYAKLFAPGIGSGWYEVDYGTYRRQPFLYGGSEMNLPNVSEAQAPSHGITQSFLRGTYKLFADYLGVLIGGAVVIVCLRALLVWLRQSLGPSPFELERQLREKERERQRRRSGETSSEYDEAYREDQQRERQRDEAHFENWYRDNVRVYSYDRADY